MSVPTIIITIIVTKENVRILTRDKIMIDERRETMTTDNNGMIIMKIGGPEVGIEIGTYHREIHQATIRELIKPK